METPLPQEEGSCLRPSASGGGSWDYCTAAPRHTEGGAACLLPFAAGNVTHHDCTLTGRLRPWCAPGRVFIRDDAGSDINYEETHLNCELS